MLALHPDRGVVIGVDTHKETHTAAAVGATGAVLEYLTVPADPAGYRQLIAFGRRHTATLWAIEGTGSFGAGLTTALLARCERIVEVDRPQRPARRGGVKSDDIDAVRAARQALAGVGLGEPRRRGDREAIRVLLTTRAQAVTFRTRAISALHALVASAPDALRERLRTLPLGQLLQTCAGLRDSSRRSIEESATVLAMRSTRTPRAGLRTGGRRARGPA
jgi:transposase